MRASIYLISALGSYAALLILSQRLLSTAGDLHGMRIAIALTPMLPAVFICWVIVRQIRHLDELHRKLQFEALAVSVAGTALITFGYGFLEGEGLPKISMFAVWPLMAALWVVSFSLLRLRFR